MSEKPVPKPGDPHYSEAQMRRGLTLSWLEAFRIVPEQAETEVHRIIEELEQAKATAKTLTEELRCVNNRADNCGSYLRELKRNLGIGDYPRAEVCLAQAWKRLFPDLDLKGGA